MPIETLWYIRQIEKGNLPDKDGFYHSSREDEDHEQKRKQKDR